MSSEIDRSGNVPGMSILLARGAPAHYRIGMSDEYWGTASELEWLARLGTHGEPGSIRRRRRPQPDRAELLRGYLRGSRRRTEWGPIDSAEVIGRAEQMLAEMQAGRRA